MTVSLFHARAGRFVLLVGYKTSNLCLKLFLVFFSYVIVFWLFDISFVESFRNSIDHFPCLSVAGHRPSDHWYYLSSNIWHMPSSPQHYAPPQTCSYPQDYYTDLLQALVSTSLQPPLYCLQQTTFSQSSTETPLLPHIFVKYSHLPLWPYQMHSGR